MPITATLSRKFYEKFGDEVTNELVAWLNAVDSSYRQEFRELFAAHFGQLRAEMQAEIAGLRAEMQAEIAGLRADMDTRFAELRAEMQAEIAGLRADMDRRFAELRADMDRRFAELRAEMATNLASADDVRQLEMRVTALEGRMAAFQEKIAGDLKGTKSELVGWMVGLWFVSVALAILTRAFGG